MKQPDLAFQRITVHEMPGFEDGGFSLDGLDPCINIITGPNASGKTTTARALTLLLWPSDDHDWPTDAARVSGELLLDDEAWIIGVQRGGAEFLRGGMESDQFPAPAERTWDRYNLALHELIQTDDEAFAAQILRESAGGYDLEAAAEHLGYSDGLKTRNVGEYREYQKSHERLREIRREQEDLKEEQRRLEELKRSRRSALEARQRAEVLSSVIAYREAERELEACKTALGGYPEGIEHATGEEDEQIRSLNEEIAITEDRLEEAREEKQRARATIDSLDLPNDGIDDDGMGEVVSSLSEYVEAIEERNRRISQREEELEGCREEAEQVLDDLAPDVSVEDLGDIDLGDVSRIDRFAERSEDVRAKQKALAMKEKWLGTPEETVSTEELHRGIKILQGWLREGKSRKTSFVSVRSAAAAVAATLGAGILAYVFGPIGWLFLIVPAALLLYEWTRSSPSDDTVSRRVRQKDYQSLDLTQPEEWTVENVEALVSALYDKFLDAKLEEKRQERWEMLQDHREEIAREEEQLEQKRSDLQKRVGEVLPVEGDVSLAYFLQKLQRFQAKREKISGLEGRIDRLRDQNAETLALLNRELSSIGHSEVSDEDNAVRVVGRIERAYETYREASRTLDAAEEKIRMAEETISNREKERSRIYDKLGIEEGHFDEVERLLQQLESYGEAERKEFSARDRRNEARATMREYEAYTSDLEDEKIGVLEEQLEACQEEAARIEDINEEISRIQALVDKQQHQHELERALAERDRRLEALGERRAENLRSLVGDALAGFIEEKTRYQSRPAVLREADRLFRRITGGRYRLLLGSAEEPSFKARDTRQERTYSLEELSSGTRIQLLLAVRMGFVEVQERTVKFPLFVDEVLANSDDIRARAIIDALVEICEDGRQIFYFTAQTDEVGKWHGVLDDRDISCAVHSLSGAEPVAAVDYPSGNGFAFDLVHRVSAPGEDDHESYGERLDVPEFRPLVESIEQLHLWYLIEDPELLHECLVRGIDTWGPLKTYIDGGGRIPGADDDELQKIRDTAGIVAEVLELYRRGRSRPVPPRELQQTDAVTDNFIDEVTQLLREVEGDPEQLVRALEEGQVSGFRTTKREELEMYLEERGYIDPDGVIPEEELQVHIQNIISRHPAVDAEDIQRVLNRLRGN
jgi:uncharacterized protein YhaN